jgi:hypothetical protein
MTYRLRLARNGLKVKVATRIPAQLVAGTGVSITKANGVYTFDMDTDELETIAEATANAAVAAAVGVDIQGYDADLAALAANSTDGLWAHTGAGTGAARTITGTANEITATNGNGVSGNPTLSLPTALTFTGKTVTGGTFSAPALSSPTMTTPALGTPASGVLTNCTGYVNTSLTASLGADVNLNNTGTYFDGPSVAQGTSGTWFASGTVTLIDTAAGPDAYDVKLWDGTTVIASARAVASAANIAVTVGLSGYLASPAGNIRISVKDVSNTTGVIKFNLTGNSKDSTVSVISIA